MDTGEQLLGLCHLLMKHHSEDACACVAGSTWAAPQLASPPHGDNTELHRTPGCAGGERPPDALTYICV
jgi:hypothetical protein